MDYHWDSLSVKDQLWALQGNGIDQILKKEK